MNQRNAESAFLAARSRFETWRQKFEAQWSETIMKDQAKASWNRMPTEIQDRVTSSLSPSAKNTLTRFVGGKEK